MVPLHGCTCLVPVSSLSISSDTVHYFVVVTEPYCKSNKYCNKSKYSEKILQCKLKIVWLWMCACFYALCQVQVCGHSTVHFRSPPGIWPSFELHPNIYIWVAQCQCQQFFSLSIGLLKTDSDNAMCICICIYRYFLFLKLCMLKVK